VLEWIANTPELGTELLTVSHGDGVTIAHEAAAGGHADVLRWISSVDELGAGFLKRQELDGSTVAHTAAREHT